MTTTDLNATWLASCLDCDKDADAGWTDGEVHARCCACETALALADRCFTPQRAQPDTPEPVRVVHDATGAIRLVYANDRAYTPDALCELLTWAEKQKARLQTKNRRQKKKYARDTAYRKRRIAQSKASQGRQRERA